MSCIWGQGQILKILSVYVLSHMIDRYPIATPIASASVVSENKENSIKLLRANMKLHILPEKDSYQGS